MNSAYKKSVFQNAAKVAHLTYQIGESDLLREKSGEVKPKDIKLRKIQTVISKLKNVLLQYRKLTGRGRGIAAVQIGIPLKVAVIFVGKDFLTIINPKIIGRSEKLLIYPEICMSANPIIARVIRPRWIEVSYLDGDGNKKVWHDRRNLILNRVFAHEIDHMQGIINIDLVGSKDLILDSDPGFLKQAKFETVRQTKEKL